MFYPLTGSQIFGFSPNNLKCYATTTLLQHKKTLFAFASDNNIIIYDRLSLKSQIISIKDKSPNIVSITFTGHGDHTSIFCVNERGKLFSYLLTDTSKPVMEVETNISITSMTASNEYLFCHTGSILYAIPITYNSINLKEKIILSETLMHEKLLISPCGRCLATYTQGAKYPIFWYAPFERRRRSNLPIDGHISDFQWGSSDRLLGVTATLEGIVRVWEESTTSYQLRCVKWFDCGSKVLSAAIITSADIENQIELKNCKKAQSDSGRVFPSVKRQKVLVMAVVEDERRAICILQEKKHPQLFFVGRLVVSLDSPIATFADMKRIFSEGELKRLISTVRFSQSSVAFDQFELGNKKVTHVTPLNLPFITSPIVSIQKQGKIMTHHRDGSLFNWWKMEKMTEKCKYLEMTEFKEGTLTVKPTEVRYEVQNNVKSANQTVSFSEPVTFSTVSKFDNNAVIASVNSHNIYMVILNVKEELNGVNYKFEVIPIVNSSENILSITIHSTDLFAVSTKKSVDAYFYTDGNFVKIASYKCENPCALFIPHPMALIAISSVMHLKFYIVWSNRFIPIEEFDENLNNDYPYPLFTSMSLTDDGSIIASTEHSLYDLEFYASNFPIPYPIGNNLILNTSFTLCYFYILSELLNGHKITIESYRVKMHSELFSFPNKPPIGVAKAISDVCTKPPESWGNLDENGLRFLFSWIMINGSDMKDLYYLSPFFSIWALLSVDQSGLITSLKPTSAKMIYDMKIEIWTKDIEVLKKALNSLVENTIPSDSEFDTFLLFCILLNRKFLAKKIARLKNQSKLENFFLVKEMDQKMLKKIEKSAFEAQKVHRNPLAAMFFTLKGMKKQALFVLRDNIPLYLITLRLLNEENWFESIPKDFVNGFFTKWWRFYVKRNEYLKKFNGRLNSSNSNEVDLLKKDAVESLKSWKFKRSEKISIEAHKFEMLKSLDASTSSDLLSLQLTPGFIEMQAIEQNSEMILVCHLESNDNNKTSEPVKSESAKVDSNEKQSQVKDSVSSFDFGGAGDDWDESDFSSSDDEEEDETKNAKTDEIETDKLFENEHKKSEKLFDSNFYSTCHLHPFNSPGPICYTLDEKFIVSLISSLFNFTYNEGTIKIITYILRIVHSKAKNPKQKYKIPIPRKQAASSPSIKKPVNPSVKKKTSILIAILYSLTYAFSKANMMMTLFSEPLNLDTLDPLIADFVNIKKMNKTRKPPNLLKKFVEENVEVDENDRLLANFISFNEICKVLIRQGLLSKIQMLISFFHHRHRFLFSELNSFCFVQKNYILDLETIGLKCGNIFEQIRLNMMNRKWRVTMVNQFISPFYFGDRFQCTKTYEIQTSRFKNEELSTSSSSDDEEITTSYLSSNYGAYSEYSIRKKANAFDTPVIQSKSVFDMNENDRKRLMTTSSSSSNLYSSSSVVNKISPPSVVAVCVNPQNLSEVAIGGKNGVEIIDISKPDNISTSTSNPNFCSHPSLIDIVDTLVDTDEQFFNKLARENNGMTKSVSTNFANSASAKNSHLTMQNSNDSSSIDVSSPIDRNSVIKSPSTENTKNAENSQQPLDSPFASLMGQAKVNNIYRNANERKSAFYQKRKFEPAWPKDKVSLKDLDAMCMASHPREPYFIIGTASGRLYMANFGRKSSSTISSVLYNDCPVISLELNDTGDRLLATLDNGYVYVSNFQSAILYVSVKGANAAWLNNDTQFIVVEPMNKQFVIYDIFAGLSPVAIYAIPQSIPIRSFTNDYKLSSSLYAQKSRSRTFTGKKARKKPIVQMKTIPIAVCGHHIFTGYEDGSVVQFDLRSQSFISFKLHKSPVTCIKIDRSERFFISGSSDNSLKIVNIRVASTPQTLREVFSSYDQIPNDEPKGVSDIAITDQTIVAVGHSSTIHAWTMNEPRGLL